MRQFVCRIVCFVVWFLIAPHIFAAGEFQADYDVQYAVAPSGITIVTQNISLTNLQTNLYPQKYTILIDSVKIQNVIAYDPGGVVHTNISQKDGKTEIGLTFNDKNVGLGKRLPFTLRYESTEIAMKNGSIWEINIPGVAKDPDLATYDVTLKVPTSFGANAYMTPLPANGGRWTKEQMTRGGISAAYGDTQVFDIDLSYFLENPSVNPTVSEIALPPDTQYQKVRIKSINPKPATVEVDTDGNWLAKYELAATQRINITVSLTVQVSLVAQTAAKAGDLSLYTKPLTYWESTNQEIMQLASRYKTPRDIYQYVVSTLSYDYRRAETGGIRKGALGALESPNQAICMEFTDLFIAIARAAGIPAREVVGYSYTSNSRLRPLSYVSDVLHAWPEYYDADQGVWRAIDPTWANTTGGVNYFDKLDFNHIAFAILGASSEYPYPAGFYKRTGSKSKDVQVQFAQQKPTDTKLDAQLEFDFPAMVSAGTTVDGAVVVVNAGQTSIPNTTLTFDVTPGGVHVVKTLQHIPPFAKISVPFAVHLPNSLNQTDGAIVAQLDGATKKYDFAVRSFFARFAIPLMVGVILMIVLFIVWLRSLALWKKPKTV